MAPLDACHTTTYLMKIHLICIAIQRRSFQGDSKLIPRRRSPTTEVGEVANDASAWQPVPFRSLA